MMVNIRKEDADDIQNIHDLTVAAFSDVSHSTHTEQFIVDALRKSDALSVSLVAEVGGSLVGHGIVGHGIVGHGIVGHVAASPVTISDGAEGWYGLGPVSVMPSHQRRGVGSQLVYAALQELQAMNASGCVLLGNPEYYNRFGFKPVDGLVLSGVPTEYFQAILFIGEYPQGEVTYHPSFGAES